MKKKIDLKTSLFSILRKTGNMRIYNYKNYVVLSAKLERIFEPSSKADELTSADWFVLDENGTRQLNLNIDEEPIAEERSGQTCAFSCNKSALKLQYMYAIRL